MKLLATLTLFALIGTSTHFALANDDHAKKGAKAERDNGSLFPQPQAEISKATPPAKPELLQPAFQAVVTGENVTLTWKEVASANAYHVQVATDPNFKWLKADEHFVKGSSFEVKGLEKGHLYFWRVAGWKNDNMAGTNKSFFATSAFETK